MDIIAEKIPDDPPEPRSDAVEEAQLAAVTHVSAQEQPPLTREMTREMTMTQEDLLNPQEPPAPKRRGRPPGSNNKPQIIEQVPEDATLQAPEARPIVLNEPPAPKKPAAPRKPRAPKAPPAPRSAPSARGAPQQAPIPQTPLQVAASMLEILRLEQAERQWRKSELYKSWVK